MFGIALIFQLNLICHYYLNKKTKIQLFSHQALLKLGDSSEEKPYKLFHDDTLKTFCRRLNFSPDGLILFAPCGLLELNEVSSTTDENDSTKKEKRIHATYAFIRENNFAKPVAYYPSVDRYSVAVRCCPVLFELRPGQPSLYDIPYRMIFAVATENAILLYDTQQTEPFARIARIHYTRLTDVAW
jgi:chromatin assembly factor 1 subunit B